MPLDFIAKPLEQILVAITQLIHNYGLSIIIFTILVRLVISPLNLAQLRSARAMATLSPKLKELQKIHGKDRAQLTQATMELYKEHKVNPMAGCLPLIIQLPVLWGLFNALRALAEDCYGVTGCKAGSAAALEGAKNIYHSAFLWLPNLGHPDPIHILPIVAGITQWIQTKMMMQPTADPQQQQMNQIMQFMPLMIVVFAWQYQSGLALYWVMSTLFSIGLQYFVNHDSPNGPWGQLPILGTGQVPAFLGGFGNRTISGSAQDRSADTAALSGVKPMPRSPRRQSPQPTIITSQAVVQPRGAAQTDNADGTGTGTVETVRPKTPGGARSRGPRSATARRAGIPAKGVKK